MANSETLTDKGTRKFQCNGLAKWGSAFQRIAGSGKREAIGIRSALAFAIAHEAQWTQWGKDNAVTTLGINVVKEEKAKPAKEVKAKTAPKAPKVKAPKVAKPTKVAKVVAP